MWPRFSVAFFVIVSMLAFGLLSPAGAQVAEPTIEVTPTSGEPGTALFIAGSGFGDSCQVELSFGDTLLGFAAVAGGAFTTDAFSVPADAEAGAYVITAAGYVDDGGEFCLGPTDFFAETPFEVIDDDTPGLTPRYTPVKPVYDPATGLPDWVSQTEAHLKFRQGSEVRLRDVAGELRFVSLQSAPSQDDLNDLDAVNDLMEAHGVTASRLFDARSEAEHERERIRLEAQSGQELGDKNLYYLLVYADTTDAATLLNDLNALQIVEIAYADPLPGDEPTNHSEDYRDRQGYRTSAPGGIHADAAATLPGGRGENVQVIDIERFFNPDHEDLPAVTVYANGDPDAAWPGDAFDHGTAVMGEIFGVDNDFGVLGLADLAAAGFVSTAGGRPNAIDVATANSVAGDVILLELQRAGPLGTCSNETTPQQIGCVPEEWVQASYDAVVAAILDGIIVVAAAGNGFQDLDGAEYQDWLDRGDSGAIIVGAGMSDDDAGVSGTCGAGNVPRSRLDFSNFGSRVNVHGWGQCVTTTGYGGLSGVPNGADDAYTGGFSGTSSASPIVASAAAIVSSVFQQQGLGAPTSTQVRALLMSTGTPQVMPADNPAALAGNIGPLPNLAAALGLSADLAVTKTASPEPVAAGTNLTYTVTVTNHGPNVALDVVLVDQLPPEVLHVSDDGGCTLIGSEVTCEIGTLAVGADATIEIVASVPANLVHNAGAPVTITNTATATSSIDDPDAANSTATVDSLVVAVADLEVVSVDLSTVPGEALIGVDIPVTVTSVVRNHGPSSPIDADLDTVGTPSAGASVAPPSDVADVDALTTTGTRTVEQHFTIRCDAPGPQEVVFDVEIRPANAADSDPDLGNNTGQVTATVECILPIVINIRPANQFNQVNLHGNQVVPVAALTTEAGEYGLPLAFDATSIVPGSVRFGSPAVVWDGTGGAPFHNGIYHVHDSFELDDRTKDGDLDMWGNFRVPDSGIEPGDTEACMKGQFVSGGVTYSFFGCDFIAIQ